MRAPPLRVTLDEPAVHALAAGKAVILASTAGLRVEIVLPDVDTLKIMRAFLDGLSLRTPPPDPPQAREFLSQRRK